MFKVCQSKTQRRMYAVIEVAPPHSAWIVTDNHITAYSDPTSLQNNGNLITLEPTEAKAKAYVKMCLLLDDK